MDFKEVLGVILVPFLLFVLSGIKKEIRHLRERVDRITDNCDRCKK